MEVYNIFCEPGRFYSISETVSPGFLMFYPSHSYLISIQASQTISILPEIHWLDKINSP